MDEFDLGLAARREKYVEQLSQVEQTYMRLQAEIQNYRSKIAAIDTLIGGTETITKTANSQTEAKNLDEHGPFTPVKDYWKPILQVLVELGGRGHRSKVIAMVGEKMKNVLMPADLGRLPKTGHIRWRNRVAWQASQMRSSETGFIKSDSHRGIWEITEEGRKWLDDKRN
jgi:hypothetical protein